MSVSTIRRLPVVAAAFTLLSAAAEASGQPLDHANPPRTLMVEHAEIVIADPDGSPARGFLTIWNGTETPAYLASVRSDAFESITIMRTLFTSGDDTVEPVSGLAIPAHAELQMREGGIHLLLAGSASPIDQSEAQRLTLTFGDGREVEVSAVVVPRPDLLTNHRHARRGRSRRELALPTDLDSGKRTTAKCAAIFREFE